MNVFSRKSHLELSMSTRETLTKHTITAIANKQIVFQAKHKKTYHMYSCQMF